SEGNGRHHHQHHCPDLQGLAAHVLTHAHQHQKQDQNQRQDYRCCQLVAGVTQTIESLGQGERLHLLVDDVVTPRQTSARGDIGRVVVVVHHHDQAPFYCYQVSSRYQPPSSLYRATNSSVSLCLGAIKASGIQRSWDSRMMTLEESRLA